MMLSDSVSVSVSAKQAYVTMSKAETLLIVPLTRGGTICVRSRDRYNSH